MNRSYIFAAILLFFCSCQRALDVQLAPSTPGSGTSTGGLSNINYQPTNKDSYWTYKSTGSRTYETTTTSTGIKKTQNEINFTIVNTVAPGMPQNESMYGRKDRNYYVAAAGISPSGATFNINKRYLNDTARVGYTWDHRAGQGNGFEAVTRGEIVERNMTIVVAGKTFKEVIHSRLQLDYEVPGFGVLPAAIYDYYTANNIGIVKLITTTSALVGGEVIIQELTAYAIK